MISPQQIQAMTRQHIHRLGQLYASGYFERLAEADNQERQEDRDAREFLDWVEQNLAEIAALPTPDFREIWSLFLDLVDAYYTSADKKRVLRKAKSLNRKLRANVEVVVARHQLENSMGDTGQFPSVQRYEAYLKTPDGGQRYEEVLCYQCGTNAERRHCARCGSDLARQRDLGSQLRRRYFDGRKTWGTLGGVVFFPIVGLAFLSGDAFLPITMAACALTTPFIVVMGWYQYKEERAVKEARRRMKTGDFTL